MKYCWQEWRSLWLGRGLLWVMTRRELSSRYAGSAMGVVWAYLQPILTIAAYFLVFDIVFSMRMGEGAPTTRMGTYLVAGALPWLAFSEALTRGAGSLVDAGSLLQKNALPPVLFVARSVLTSWVVYAPLIAVVTLGYLPVSGFGWAILAVPLLLLMQSLMTIVLAHALAILAAAMRDVLQVLTFLMSVGVYLSPVLFPLSFFPEEWRWVLFANPMSALVMGYQAVLLQGAWPGAEVWAITAVWTLVPALALNTLIQRSRDQLVDWL
jgi:lipopolysaccharide transport system permease protein